MGRIVGIENIIRYLDVSESSVMDSIQNDDLPAKKNDAARWEVDQAALDRWRARSVGDTESRIAARKKREEEAARLADLNAFEAAEAAAKAAGLAAKEAAEAEDAAEAAEAAAKKSAAASKMSAEKRRKKK